MEDFAYAPLDTDSFRLVKFTQDDGDIEGHIHSFSLDDCPRFMVTSYVWGPLDYSRHITLNGHHHAVLASIYALLEAICQHKIGGRVIWWWIDSICINQKDFLERSAQVKLMAQIYRRAERTIVWLGPASEDSDNAIEFLHLLRRNKFRLEDIDGDMMQEMRSISVRPRWTALENLLVRPWWKRVWTVQELTIARTATFFCGTASISRSDFKTAMYSVWLCGRWERRILSRAAFYPAWNRRRLHMWYNTDRQAASDGPVRELPLIGMMAFCGDHSATDPRDRIYSLLGLARDRHLVPQPNYELDVTTIFIQLVHSFINIHKSLDIICFAHVFTPRSLDEMNTPNLPSWVPDWNVSLAPQIVPLMASQSSNIHIGNFRPLTHLDATVAYAAAGHAPPRVDFSEGFRQINCAGVFIDYVDGLGDISSMTTMYSTTEILKGSMVQSTSALNSVRSEEHFSTNSSHALDSARQLLEKISRCLVLDRKDRYLCHRAPQPKFADHFQAFCFENFSNPDDVHLDFATWLHHNQDLLIQGRSLATLCLIDSTVDFSSTEPPTDFKDTSDWESFLSRFRDVRFRMSRRLMVTEGGNVGMAPSRARKRDVICVLSGCNIPVLLRPIAPEDGDEHGGIGSTTTTTTTTYEFLGECFLDGYMNGEAMSEVEEGKKTIDIFSIR